RLSLGIVKIIFGLEGEGASLLIGTAIGIALLIIVFVIMFKVDWEKRFAKYVEEKPNRQPSEGAAAKQE
ncbi:MAG: hypothetical protein ACPLKZ_00250, partial [Candidatus Bathyarchaeales archaeon]